MRLLNRDTIRMVGQAYMVVQRRTLEPDSLGMANCYNLVPDLGTSGLTV